MAETLIIKTDENLTFMDKLISRTILAEDIDEYVKTWHEGNQEESLQAFLGMTDVEYGQWTVHGNQALPEILACIDAVRGIVAKCTDLPANEHLTVTDFGPKGYELHIYKDEDFDPKVDEDLYNMVDVMTRKDDIPEDDAIGVHVTDGSLYGELERIWYSKDMGLLP